MTTLDPVQRRTMRVLVIAQILSGAGLAAGISVGALLAADMLGSESFGGLPAAVFTTGAALSAAGIGALTHRYGRRPGLAGGYLIGAMGAAGVAIAAVTDTVPLLFASMFVYGAGSATNLQARYAGADLAPPAARARAVSMVLVATTLGAVAGPNLVTATGEFALSVGAPALSGPFMLAALAYGAAGLVLAVFLRPDPLLVARQRAATQASADAEARLLADPTGESAAAETPALTPGPRWLSPVWLGAGTMVVAQFVMAAVMTMTPIYMVHHGHSVGAAGFVIGLHIAAMYLPSPLSGWLVDKQGPARVIALSAVTLALAGLVAALSPADSLPLLTFALILLGLGWSLGLVAGSALVVTGSAVETRARTQGRVDVTIALAGAMGGGVSGVIVAAFGYPELAAICGVVALAALAWVGYCARLSETSLR